jgi:curved DNA-binding protein CbpA
MDKTMDLYAELGVAPQAEPDVIRAAYRALAKRYHPDRQEGAGLAAAAKMARLNGAYEVLGHPDSRRLYDRQRLQAQAKPVMPLVHRSSCQDRLPSGQPFLTTYDQRGRIHAYV